MTNKFYSAPVLFLFNAVVPSQAGFTNSPKAMLNNETIDEPAGASTGHAKIALRTNGRTQNFLSVSILMMKM
jgi:hypothetical protein